MKFKSIIATVTSVFLLFINLPIANAEEIQISCPGGGSYTLILPAGVALNGKSCVGKLTLDNRTRIVGKDAFAFSEVTSVEMPNSVTTIENDGFAYTSFSTILLGNGLETLGTEAFRMAKFTSIDLPNSLKTIGECAFCDTIFSTITLPNSLTSIGRNAFTRDFVGTPLVSIEIPDSVREIGAYAFSNSKLQSIKIGSSLKEIPGGAFQYNKLKSVVIPANIEFIGAFAFKLNPLESVEINYGVTGIDSEAFMGTKLTEVMIPDSVTQIGTRAFANISTLRKVVLSENFQQFRNSDNALWVGDVFDESYGISQIDYCGKMTGFLIPPVCSEAKKAAIAEQSKVLADKKAKSQAEIRANFISSVKATIPILIDENRKDGDLISPEKLVLASLESAKKLSAGILGGARSKTSSIDDIQLAASWQRDANEFAKLSEDMGKRFNSISDRVALDPQRFESAKLTGAYYLQLQNLFMNGKVASEEIAQLLINLAKQKETVGKSVVNKLSTITCIKGKLTKKITAVSPKCPVGYKKT